MRRLIFISVLLTSWILASGKVAIAVKASGQVSLISTVTKVEQPLKRGTGLTSKDLIRTGKDGFVVAMYLDDKTTIKIRENAEFTVGGTRAPDGINKRISLTYGTLHASVASQKGKEFIIATPTSVAAIKGTDLVVISDPILGDLFITLIGTIEVTNNSTGQTTTVNEGQSANSTPDGNLDVGDTNEDDIPDFEDGDEDSSLHELRFEIEDENGTIRDVIIQYE